MRQQFRDSLSPDTAAAAELFQHDGALSEVDPAIADLIKQEKGRQVHGLELIASENFTSRAVRLPYQPAGAASAVMGTSTCNNTGSCRTPSALCDDDPAAR